MQTTPKGIIARIALLILAFIVLFALIVSARLHATNSIGQNTVSAVPTFSANHHRWLVGQNWPHNVIMHWHEYSQVGLSPSPSDPGNGKIITADKWVETNSSNEVVFDHVIYTLPDGSVYQEYFDNAATSIIIRGPAYAAIDGPAAGDPPEPFWCVSQRASYHGFGSFAYVNDQGLQADHFAETTEPLARPTPPDANALPGVTPSAVLTVPSSIHSWQGKGLAPDDHDTDVIRFDADDQGRVIVSDLQAFDTTGRLISVQWYSIGKISLYPPTVSLPAWVDAVPSQVTKGCNA